jgi:predicted negative regulator of RcsB-dependent stress response
VGIFRTKEIVAQAQPVERPDAPETRFNMASALHESALAVYHDIADRLTEAHARYSSLVTDIDAEIAHLSDIRTAAVERARKAKDSAVSILDMTRNFRND